MDNRQTMGSKLRQLRKNRHMTQQEVADKVKITRSTISNYEIGRRMPHLSDLQKLSEVFGVGLDYFGISAKNEAYDLLARAQELFRNEDVSDETKEQLYQEFMKMYLKMKSKGAKIK